MHYLKLIVILTLFSSLVVVSCNAKKGSYRPSGEHKKHRAGSSMMKSREARKQEEIAASYAEELVDNDPEIGSETVPEPELEPAPEQISDISVQVFEAPVPQLSDAEILEQRKNITMNQNVMVDTSHIELTTGKKLSIPRQGASESLSSDRIHDNDNIAIGTLQNPVKAMANFPRDRRQQVDWVKTLDEGLIEPRADLHGKTTMQTLDKDILMKNTQFMPYVKFPHLQHTRWLACSNCHPKIFIAKEHANPISMNKVLRGEFCGVCHDKVAFAIFTCERCHSVPHEGSGPKWW